MSAVMLLLAGCLGPDPGSRDLAGCVVARHDDFDADGEPDEQFHLRHDAEARVVQSTWFAHGTWQFLDQAYDDAGCLVESVSRDEDPFGRFHQTRSTSICDRAENPDWTWYSEESGTVPLVDAADERSIRYENYYQGSLLVRVVTRLRGGERVQVSQRDFEHDSHGRVVREVLDGGDTVIETSWYDAGPFAERTTTSSDGRWVIVERQEVDEHGRITHEERWEGGDLRQAVDREWDAQRYAVQRELWHHDGDGIADVRMDASCVGDPVVWCSSTWEWLDRPDQAPSLTEQTWTCAR